MSGSARAPLECLSVTSKLIAYYSQSTKSINGNFDFISVLILLLNVVSQINIPCFGGM